MAEDRAWGTNKRLRYITGSVRPVGVQEKQLLGKTLTGWDVLQEQRRRQGLAVQKGMFFPEYELCQLRQSSGGHILCSKLKCVPSAYRTFVQMAQ